MAPTWFITGCSSGFGYHIALKALEQGHNVIASSRNPSKTPDLVEKITSQYNGRGYWVQLDVNSQLEQIQSSIADAEKLFGSIDVLVNNAGWVVQGALEEIPEEKYRQILETHFFGPLKLCKAVLPAMRERRSGTIVNISSVAGVTAMPTSTAYSASKWAIEALSESLSGELASFNIRVLLVVPGRFRKNILNANADQLLAPSEAYKGTIVDQVHQNFIRQSGKQPGDPEKAAQRIFEAVTGTGMGEGKGEFLRVILGKGC